MLCWSVLTINVTQPKITLEESSDEFCSSDWSWRDWLDYLLRKEGLARCGWHHSLGRVPEQYKRRLAERKQERNHVFIPSLLSTVNMMW